MPQVVAKLFKCLAEMQGTFFVPTFFYHNSNYDSSGGWGVRNIC